MMTYIRTSSTDPDFHKLIIDLDKELWERYPDIQQNFAPFNFVDDSFRVIVAKEGEALAGCGCFRPMKEKVVVEIKRMYVIPSFRGKGVGKMILRKLEQWATDEGFVQAKLETGINQPEAIAAYEKSGYARIPNFDPYVNIEESICMMKYL
ncbi:MAG: GNAT family N-acetyltransferase [Bacteroidota bacterium]